MRTVIVDAEALKRFLSLVAGSEMTPAANDLWHDLFGLVETRDIPEFEEG